MSTIWLVFYKRKKNIPATDSDYASHDCCCSTGLTELWSIYSSLPASGVWLVIKLSQMPRLVCSHVYRSFLAQWVQYAKHEDKVSKYGFFGEEVYQFVLPNCAESFEILSSDQNINAPQRPYLAVVCFLPLSTAYCSTDKHSIPVTRIFEVGGKNQQFIIVKYLHCTFFDTWTSWLFQCLKAKVSQNKQRPTKQKTLSNSFSSQ